jgi:peptidoglycan/LPS O-acetylase OafA/YrhL
MKERFIQLDALRGLAALTVVLHHVAQHGGKSQFAEVFFYTAASPLSIFIKGHEAVIFFFVLSGFVLSLPLLNGKQPSYFGYLIKRFFRIYVPYILSFFIGLWVFTVLSDIPRVTEGAPDALTKGISVSVILEHIAGLGNIHTNALNNVYWSLIHEMRISIIFPFVALFLLRIRWHYSVIIALLLTGIASFNTVYVFEVSNGFFTTYFDSLHYLSFFIYGFLLARYRHNLIAWYRSLKTGVKIALLTASYICYMYTVYPFAALERLVGTEIPFNVFMRDQINAFGIAVFIILSLASNRVGKLLQTRIPLFLGNISYSLYLYHLVILFAIIHEFGQMPLLVLLLLMLTTSLFVAYILWRFIERPSMQLGKLWSQRNDRRAALAHPRLAGRKSI